MLRQKGALPVNTLISKINASLCSVTNATYIILVMTYF